MLSATLGVGCGGGLIMAGLLEGDHRAVFWTQAALAALSLLLVAAVVRERHARAPGRPDLAGAALVALWLGCLLLAVSKGAAWGWTSPATLGLFAAAAAVAGAAVWAVTARRTPHPLIEIPMLLHRATVGATVASFLMGLALFTAITTVSAVAQGRLGASVLQVGLYLLPTTLLMLVTSVLAGPLMRRYTASALVAAGSALVSASALWLALSDSSPPWTCTAPRPCSAWAPVSATPPSAPWPSNTSNPPRPRPPAASTPWSGSPAAASREPSAPPCSTPAARHGRSASPPRPGCSPPSSPPPTPASPTHRPERWNRHERPHRRLG
ncbi:hypothetical protein GCM10020001_106280 [Nonomuraea salmonea]